MPHRVRRSRQLFTTVAALTALSGIGSAQVPVIEKLMQIGCSECEGPTQFSTIFDAAVTDSGDIVAVDRSAPMIRAFDRTGKVLWSSGRSGNGPGEFQFPMRVALGPDRTVGVVDMGLRRLTRLAKDGSATGSHPIPAFPGAAAARGRSGELLFLMDDFRGSLSAERWVLTASKPEPHAQLSRPTSTRPGMVQPSIAIAQSGIMAFILDPFTYRIGRLGADGRAMPDIVRDIPQPHRSAAEMKELSDRIASGPARRNAERGSASATAPAGPPGIDLSLKPHVILDGLRFDDLGRLWVLTMRGTGQQSVFDIFTPAGTFLGTVTLPTRVHTYSLAGSYLVTGGDDADDIPRLTLWRVRG